MIQSEHHVTKDNAKARFALDFANITIIQDSIIRSVLVDMVDCKCRHGKKEHTWNTLTRTRIGPCMHTDMTKEGIKKPCLCQDFKEASPGDWFKEWEETIRNLEFRH